MSDYTPAVESPIPEKRSNPFSRMIGVLTSPSETFADIARTPDWLVPAVVLVVVTFIAILVTVPRVDFEGTYREAFEAQHMPAQQMEQALKWGMAFGRATMYVSPLFVLGGLAVAAAIYFLGIRLMNGAGTYAQAFSVVLYASMPRVLKAIITIPVTLTKHGIRLQEVESVLRSNPGFLVDMKAQPVLHALLSTLDVFAIWSLVLLVIGFAAMSKLSRAKVAVVVIVVWCLTVLLRVGGAAVGALRARAS
jgi:hypothetical protein